MSAKPVATSNVTYFRTKYCHPQASGLSKMIAKQFSFNAHILAKEKDSCNNLYEWCSNRTFLLLPGPLVKVPGNSASPRVARKLHGPQVGTGENIEKLDWKCRPTKLRVNHIFAKQVLTKCLLFDGSLQQTSNKVLDSFLILAIPHSRWDLSFLIRGQTSEPCFGSAES